MKNYDAVIIGSGLGGLLIGALLSKKSKKILILEKLNFIGGRFTSVHRDGFEISTGAAHMVPHGSKGTLARILREKLGLDCKIQDSDVLVSLSANNKHLTIKNITDLKKLPFFLSLRSTIDFIKIAIMMKWIKLLDDKVSFFEWVQQYTKSQKILRLFECAANIGAGITTRDISYNEMRKMVKNTLKLGASGVIQGGCRAIINELGSFIRNRQGVIKLKTEVKEILIKDKKVEGVVYYDREKKKNIVIRSPIIISDIGPKDTFALIQDNPHSNLKKALQDIREAEGLKIHFSSKKSLIDHTGIMLCLNTSRIAGIAQPSNADPNLAPPGKHLLISFQVLKSYDIKKEIELGINDLRHVFGRDFDHYCDILNISVFRKKWPVNRAIQGKDLPSQTPIEGLYLVGDACKPPGYIMANGVAKGVENLFNLLTKTNN